MTSSASWRSALSCLVVSSRGGGLGRASLSSLVGLDKVGSHVPSGTCPLAHLLLYFAAVRHSERLLSHSKKNRDLGGARGTRTPDPLLAKYAQTVGYCRSPG